MIERLGSSVRTQLARFGEAGAATAVVPVWTDAVGETIARHAWPARVGRDGTLHVATESSTWAFELTQLAPRVLERLRERLGERAPKALRFAPGPLPEPPVERSEPPARAMRQPGAAEWALADGVVASMDDGELRDLVRRAAAASLAARRD